MIMETHIQAVKPHASVLLNESIDALNVSADGMYLDGTFGRGGHSHEILSRLSERGLLVALDRDPSAIAYGNEVFGNDERLELVHTDFAQSIIGLQEKGLPEKFDGILFDLGVSSPQLDEAHRGFSFMQDGPLDMRMDSSQGQTAAQLLAYIEEKELASILFTLGDEKFSRKIAKAIIEKRIEEPLETTSQLVALIEEVITRPEKHKHPATRTFLALRMFINDELGQIETMLPQAIRMLKPGGRLAVISFHSREDRIVKRFFKNLSVGPVLPKRLPVQGVFRAPITLIGKAIKPSAEELRVNPRARSAILRIAEKTEVEYA